MAEADPRPPDSLDDIRIFLGDVPDEEYELRRRLRTARNCASFRANSAESPTARQLLWLCCETATAWVYAPSDMVTLKSVSEFCRRLLITAEQAESLDLG